MKLGLILTWVFGCLLTSLPVHSADEAAIDSMAQRMRACEGCHGAQGRATEDGFYPRIAGKPAGYLYAQLRHFRDGRRHQAQMHFLLQNLDNAYLEAMASYFAAQVLPYRPPASEAWPEADRLLGRALVFEGDPARGLPACADCHGQSLMGQRPFVAGLLGLPYDYLVAQLGAWQQGVRAARAPDCMADIASLLSPAEIHGLAAWLSSQPVESGATPEQAPDSRSVHCGSFDPWP